MKSLFGIAAFILFASTSLAGPKDEDLTAAQRSELKKSIEVINDKRDGVAVNNMTFHCGYSIPVSYNYELYAITKRDNTGGSLFCGHARLAMLELCQEDAAYKETIAKKIKSVYCVLDKNPKHVGCSLNKKEGVLEISLGEKINGNGPKSELIECLKKDL